MIYLYYLLVSGFFLLGQLQQSKFIRTHEFLGVLVNFEAGPDVETREESDQVGAINGEEREIPEEETEQESESGTIYFYKKIHAELQL